MDFVIKNLEKSIADLSREIGYVIIDTNKRNEYNMVRKLDRDNYPRFHIYMQQLVKNFNFSLHLDQKKPVYEGSGSHAHNGEYFGPLIENEVDRIKDALSNQDAGTQDSHGSGWEN